MINERGETPLIQSDYKQMGIDQEVRIENETPGQDTSNLSQNLNREGHLEYEKGDPQYMTGYIQGHNTMLDADPESNNQRDNDVCKCSKPRADSEMII